MRSQALLKALAYLRKQYTLPDECQRGLVETEEWLMRVKSTGSRLQREHTMSRAIEKSLAPPLIGGLPVFAMEVLDGAGALIETSAAVCEDQGYVAAQQFNATTAAVKLLVAMEFPLQRLSVLTRCYYFLVKPFPAAASTTPSTSDDIAASIARLVQANTGSKHLVRQTHG